MGLYEYVITIIVFIVVVTGLATVCTSTAVFYGVSPTGAINSEYNQLNTTEQLAFNLYDDIDSGAIESSSTDFGIVRGSVGAIKQVYDGYNTTKYLAKTVQKDYNIPPIYYAAFVSISLLTVVFGIIFMVFRYRG